MKIRGNAQVVVRDEVFHHLSIHRSTASEGVVQSLRLSLVPRETATIWFVSFAIVRYEFGVPSDLCETGLRSFTEDC